MSEARPDHRSFPTTQWSQIELAGKQEPHAVQPALEQLLRRYMPAMRAHLLIRRGIKRDDVEDLLQSFVSGKVLEAGLIGQADRARGRFRTFLLTALDRFVISEQRRANALKRGRALRQSLDATDESHEQATVIPAAESDVFDVAWARTILREALARMRQQCEVEGRADLWGVFQSRVAGPTLFGEPSPPYEEIVSRWSYRSPSQLWNAVRSGKQLFARMLRQVVAEYSSSADEVEAELMDLRRICARSAQAADFHAYP